MDHVNATIEDVEKLREEPPYPETSACIIKCLLEKVTYTPTYSYYKYERSWQFV